MGEILAGILGGFIGAWLMSHSDRQGRLFDRLAEAFGHFLMKFDDAVEKTIKECANWDNAPKDKDWEDTV